MWKFHKLQRGSALSLFIASSIASYFNPHMLYIAGLSLVGVIAYDIMCFLREKHGKDHSPELAQLKQVQNELVEKVQAIRDDASLGKLAETFRRNK